MSKTQSESGIDRHGRTNPLSISIACKCEGCKGELPCDSINVTGTLICTVCYCAYTMPANKEIRR